jgi:GNAT superfamily N-acetyltransferase
LQAPEKAEELANACVKHSGRKVTAIVGPLEQIRSAGMALGLAGAPAAMDADESLYALDLSGIVIPRALADGEVVCRPPHPEERATLFAWRLAYDIETLGATDSDETRDRAARVIDMQIADDNAWVALAGGNPVSLSAFNAALPDIVQLGGIYTPPEFRGKGYARAAVAHSLLVARDRGATRAILFPNNPSAVRSYESVGFRRIGDYGMVLFR